MALPKLRAILAVALALTITVGLATHSVGASDMNARMTAAVVDDMPMPGGCNGCVGDDVGMATTACITLCGGVVAVLPQVEPLAIVVAMARSPVPAAPMLGHNGPPDPYPPRSNILS